MHSEASVAWVEDDVAVTIIGRPYLSPQEAPGAALLPAEYWSQR